MEDLNMIEATAKPNKRALLIGINAYPNLPDYSQLRGCVYDVQIMGEMLETLFGFPRENIVVLVDAQATEKGIREALEKLLSDCDEGDIVVVHYSGHGSQMAARGDKPRGYDESIMPSDSGRMNPAFPKQVEPRDIRDTEIHEWLLRLSQKTPYITLIFDSCHSGSITRLSGDSTEEGTRIRWVPPDPLPQETGIPVDVPKSRGPASGARMSGWLPLSDKYVSLAACAAEQGAYELDHEADGTTLRNGAFTYFLTQEITQAANQNTCTYKDIWEQVAFKVNNRFQKQTPLLEGARDRQIFNVKELLPMRYLLVMERQGAEVQLNGGAIHGLTVGSSWEIYPAGTKIIAEAKAARRGMVEITSVGSITASAKILEENKALPIAANARAVEALHADSEPALPVWLSPAAREHEQATTKLRDTLLQSKLLKIVESAAEAQVEVRIRWQEPVAAQDATQSQANASAEARWAILDRSETLLMPEYLLAASESRGRIKENLEIIWRYQKVLELRNEKSVLKGKVNFVLLKKSDSGKWQEVAESDEEVVYQAGDAIAFRVVNRSGMPIFATVLDIGLSKRIDVLYPPAGASEEIAVKRSGDNTSQGITGGLLSVGENAADAIELFFPDDLTFLEPSAEGRPLQGKEYFKLIVTTQRHDLNFLKQSGLRDDVQLELVHPLERLTYLAVTGELKREVRRKLDPQDEWFTIERAFWLRQK
jgi:Caspase domain